MASFAIGESFDSWLAEIANSSYVLLFDFLCLDYEVIYLTLFLFLEIKFFAPCTELFFNLGVYLLIFISDTAFLLIGIINLLGIFAVTLFYLLNCLLYYILLKSITTFSIVQLTNYKGIVLWSFIVKLGMVLASKLFWDSLVLLKPLPRP